MRKNPYNKKLKDQLPLFMAGPSMTTALITNEGQKPIVEKSMVPPLHKYEVGGISFTMVQTPIINQNGTFYPQDILNLEMGQTEVTQKLFETVMGWNKSRAKNSPQNPVEMVTWFDCIAFCNKLSNLLGFQPCYEILDVRMRQEHIVYAKVVWNEGANGFRLPKVEEWVIFAEAGTQNRWAGTDDEDEIDEYVWYDDNSGNEPHPVGEKLPNEWGLYDMTGNVSEWCWDKYYYYEDYDENDFDHPDNPDHDEDGEDDEDDDSQQRRVRGGSYFRFAGACQIDFDVGYDADEPRLTTGFRICRTIK